MSSNILNTLSMDNIYMVCLIIILVTFCIMIIVIIQGIQLIKLKKKYNKFMNGKDAESLESKIIGLYEDNTKLFKHQKENSESIKNINTRMENTFQKVGIVRYDAYQQLGGMLSFSIALLDETNSGFILNSVHSTDSCYTYTKEIKSGKCNIELSSEEKNALINAMQK